MGQFFVRYNALVPRCHLWTPGSTCLRPDRPARRHEATLIDRRAGDLVASVTPPTSSGGRSLG